MRLRISTAIYARTARAVLNDGLRGDTSLSQRVRRVAVRCARSDERWLLAHPVTMTSVLCVVPSEITTDLGFLTVPKIDDSAQPSWASVSGLRVERRQQRRELRYRPPCRMWGTEIEQHGVIGLKEVQELSGRQHEALTSSWPASRVRLVSSEHRDVREVIDLNAGNRNARVASGRLTYCQDRQHQSSRNLDLTALGIIHGRDRIRATTSREGQTSCRT